MIVIALILIVFFSLQASECEASAKAAAAVGKVLAEGGKAVVNATDRVKLTLKHQNVYASNSVDGKGAKSATSYDTSVYEAGLFNSVLPLNGTVISPNPRFPMVSSSAFTSNTYINFDADCGNGLSSGASLKLYTCSDTDSPSEPGVPSQRTARVFGVMMPSGNWNAITPGVPGIPGITPVPIPSFNSALCNIFAGGKGKLSSWKMEAGDLYPTMGKPYNKYLNMEHFLFRTPISQMSIFGHWIRQDKLYSEIQPLIRMPGYGAKFSGSTRKLNYEIFSLKNDETPITPGRSYNYGGGRLGISDKKLRLAGSCIGSWEKVWGPAVTFAGMSGRYETLYCLEGEYDMNRNLGFYGSLAATRYREDGLRSGDVFHGGASQAGARYRSGDRRLQADLRYQHLDPNYDPMGHHKRSTYPTNYRGPRVEMKYSWANPEEYLKGHNMVAFHYCDFSQVNPAVNLTPTAGFTTFASRDYLFPDGGADNGTAGSMKLFSPEFDIKIRPLDLEIGGYYENLRLSRGIDSFGREYDKQVGNLSLWVDAEPCRRVELLLGYREVTLSGNWYVKETPYAFNQKATIPKVGIIYENDIDLRLTAQVHFYHFKDSSPSATKNAFPSDNDWRSTLFFLETTYNF